MVAPRRAREILKIINLPGVTYEDVIRSIDWNRVLLQAKGLHMQKRLDPFEPHYSEGVCGACLLSVLLRTEEPL